MTIHEELLGYTIFRIFKKPSTTTPAYHAKMKFAFVSEQGFEHFGLSSGNNCSVKSNFI